MLKIVVICALLLGALGCQGYSVTGGAGPIVTPHLVTTSETPRELVGINSILVAPPQFAEAARGSAPNQSMLYGLLTDAADEELDLKLISGTEVLKRFESAASSDSQAKQLRLAKEMHLDGLLLTTFNQYEERQGSKVGTNIPAAVSFRMKLLRVADGAELWSGSYYFKDQALSENLFRIKDKLTEKSGPQWRNAPELARQGFKSAMSDLGSKRLQQFS
ncbi:MAG: hypothetical protein K1X83_01905 [Oligoflexia bacterium]|nr:hypothetical protein [Oligoflexia bacterium]